MIFELPTWLQQWMNIHPEGNEKVYGKIHFQEPLGSTWTLLIVVAAVLAVAYCYFRSPDASRTYRASLAIVRLAVVALLIAMIGELRFSKMHAELPMVILLIDDSASMDREDKYADDELARQLAARVQDFHATGHESDSTAATSASAPPISRLELAKTLLLENDAAFLRGIIDRKYQLNIFRVAGGVERVAGRGVDQWRNELMQLGKPVDAVEPTASVAAPAATGRPPAEDRAASGTGVDVRRSTTKLGDGYHYAVGQSKGQKIAAVIVVSDGANKEGADLPSGTNHSDDDPPDDDSAASAETASVETARFPLYAVGLGESKKALDIELANLQARDSVMVNDLVTFDFTLSVVGVNDAEDDRVVEVTLREADEATPLDSKSVRLDDPDRDGNSTQTIRFTHRPTTTGSRRYVIEAEPRKTEVDVRNNVLETVVEVRSDQVKVLLVHSYPNFEYRYLKQMLGRDETIRLTCVLQEADFDFRLTDASTTSIFPVSLDEFNVVILGDVDPDFLGPSALAALHDFVDIRGRGIIFCAGSRHLPMAYRGNPLGKLMPVDWDQTAVPSQTETLKRGTAVQLTDDAVADPIFQLADTGEQSRQVWRELPPLFWILETKARSSAQVMVEAVDARTPDQSPLPIVVYQRAGRGMILFHATDETWRWRWRVGDLHFARYWVQAVRQLAAAQGSGRPVVLRIPKDEYEAGTPIPVEVRFTDERLVPTDGKITVRIADQTGDSNDGRTRTITLSPSAGLRTLFETTVPGLPVGDYSAKLDLPAAGNKQDSSDDRSLAPIMVDEFTVSTKPGEDTPVEANHKFLVNATGKAGFFTFLDAGDLLRKLPRGEPHPTQSLDPVELWSHWLIVLVFTALLVCEWVLRKRRAMV